MEYRDTVSIKEIRKIRQDMAREAGYDVHRLAQMIREGKFLESDKEKKEEKVGIK